MRKFVLAEALLLCLVVGTAGRGVLGRALFKRRRSQLTAWRMSEPCYQGKIQGIPRF
jgi:hypothetical protein